MKRNGSLERRHKKRAERTRVLIVTEGTQTEEQYFGLLVQHLKATGVRHWPIKTHGVGRDPMRVLKAALERRDADADSFDSVWIVVDVDAHTTLPECLKLAKKEKVRAVVSNPCFEIWLVWHLREHHRPDTNTSVQALLKSEGYPDKSIPPNFPVQKYADASARAAAADKKCVPGIVGANPSTAMHKLMDYLVTV